MTWLGTQINKLADIIAERLLKPMIGAIAVAINESQVHAEQARAAAQSARRSLDAMMVRSDQIEIDQRAAEERLLVLFNEARGWAVEAQELRKLIRLTALAGDQIARRAASLEQIERTVVRRIDMRMMGLETLQQQTRELYVAEALRLNEQAEKWRKLAMIQIEAQLDALPPTATIRR